MRSDPGREIESALSVSCLTEGLVGPPVPVLRDPGHTERNGLTHCRSNVTNQRLCYSHERIAGLSWPIIKAVTC